jgi:hypothetical protein
MKVGRLGDEVLNVQAHANLQDNRQASVCYVYHTGVLHLRRQNSNA